MEISTYYTSLFWQVEYSYLDHQKIKKTHKALAISEEKHTFTRNFAGKLEKNIEAI